MKLPKIILMPLLAAGVLAGLTLSGGCGSNTESSTQIGYPGSDSEHLAGDGHEAGGKESEGKHSEGEHGASVDRKAGEKALTADSAHQGNGDNQVHGNLNDRKADAIKVKLADGSELEAEPGSLEDGLVAFLNDANAKPDKDKWFDFSQTLQFDTGKETLQPGEESDKQLANVVAILKAYPKVKIKIGGYTDNTGDSTLNNKLSQQRASTVLAELVRRGTNKAQLTGAEGYGQANAVASNDTEAGRAQNRRISISVRAK